MGIIVKKAKYIEVTFRNVITTRKTPNTIKVTDPPCVSIRLLTKAKKLFFNNSGTSFQKSQEPGFQTQSTCRYTTLSVLNRIFNIGIINAKEKRFNMADKILKKTFNTRYFLYGGINSLRMRIKSFI
jgi:hypothetical protein